MEETIRPSDAEEAPSSLLTPPGKGRYGKGYLIDTHDKSMDASVRALLGARTRLPLEASLEQYVTGIYDQGQTSSCVGWAFAQAIATRCRVVGTPILFPSPVAIYTNARAIERANAGMKPADQKLSDGGSMPSLAVQGMRTWGVPSMARWPFDPATINVEPDALKLEAASQFKLSGYYRIDSTDSTRLADIKQAISSGFPVAFGTSVDQAFEDYDGTGAIGAPDPTQILGGHMMHVIAYMADGTFLIVNQWTKDWGKLGMAVVKPAFFTCPQMGDLVVIDCSASGH